MLACGSEEGICVSWGSQQWLNLPPAKSSKFRIDETDSSSWQWSGIKVVFVPLAASMVCILSCPHLSLQEVPSMKLQTKKARVRLISSFNTKQVEAFRNGTTWFVLRLLIAVKTQNMLWMFDAPHVDNYQSGSSFVCAQPGGR